MLLLQAPFGIVVKILESTKWHMAHSIKCIQLQATNRYQELKKLAYQNSAKTIEIGGISCIVKNIYATISLFFDINLSIPYEAGIARTIETKVANVATINELIK